MAQVEELTRDTTRGTKLWDILYCDVSDVGALAGRNLSECDLGRADLEEANLAGANLKNAHLYNANLFRANLENALNVPLLSAKQEEDACRSDCE
jgi:uncharacterized protein YjbI with pentapeptide repeats